MSLTEEEWGKIGRRLFAEWRDVNDEGYLQHYVNCDKCGTDSCYGEVWWEECDAWKYRDSGGVAPKREKTQLDKDIEAIYGHTIVGYMNQEIRNLKILDNDKFINSANTVTFPIRKEPND
jgi:hypothetical protein